MQKKIFSFFFLTGSLNGFIYFYKNKNIFSRAINNHSNNYCCDLVGCENQRCCNALATHACTRRFWAGNLPDFWVATRELCLKISVCTGVCVHVCVCVSLHVCVCEARQGEAVGIILHIWRRALCTKTTIQLPFCYINQERVSVSFSANAHKQPSSSHLRHSSSVCDTSQQKENAHHYVHEYK